MARPGNISRTNRVSVNQTENVGRLSVVHPGPSSVSASGGSTADALSKALGLAGNAVQYDARNRQVASKEADRLAAADRVNTERSRKFFDASDKLDAEAAVSSGAVTRDNLDEADGSTRFLFHANETLRTREAKDFAQTLRQKYEEEFDKDAPDSELSAWWTENTLAAYEGIPDGDRRVMAPLLDAERNRLIGEHTTNQIDSTVAKIEDAAIRNTSDMWTDAKGDYKQARADLLEQFPLQDVNKMLADTLVESMRRTNDPSLILRAPPELVNNPKYAASIESARKEAETFRKEETLSATAEIRMGFFADSKIMAANGQYSGEQAKWDLEHEVVTANQGATLLAQSEAFVQKKVDISAGIAALADGRFYLVEPKDQQEVLLAAASKMKNPALGIMELGVQNNVLYDVHSRQMEGASVARPDRFQEAVSLYMTYYTKNPKFVGSTVSESQQAVFNAYTTMTDSIGMEPGEAIAALKNARPDLARATLSSRDNRDLMASAYAKAKDTAWDEDELKDTPLLWKELTDMTVAYMSMGNFTPEKSMELALNHMSTNRQPIDGFAFHRKQGWPLEDTDEMVEWLKKTYAPEGVNPEDLRIAPDFETKRSNDVILFQAGDLPFGAGVPRLNIRNEAAKWEAYKRDRDAKAVALTSVEARNIAKRGVLPIPNIN